MACRHKEMIYSQTETVCQKCGYMCICCEDCHKWIRKTTSNLYDGKRCSRCFDKYIHKNKLGIFSKDSARVNDYGKYKNCKSEISDYYENEPDSYEFDDFCVPDWFSD